MFHRWRVLSFAALAAMVSFNLRAATEVATAEELAAAITGAATDDIKLTEDIDCTGWTTCDFSGTLDGDGKTISGLTVPLFGTVSSSAQIKDIVFAGANISLTTSGNTGVLAATMKGENLLVSDIVFTNCSLYKKGSGSAGLVAGSLESSTEALVANCRIDEDCALKMANSSSMGGIIASVTANGDGAVVTVSNCVNRGTFTISEWTNSGGGILSSINAKQAKYTHMAHVYVLDCTNYVSVSFTGANAKFGGVVRYAEGGTDSINGQVHIARCANYGDITLKAPAEATAGILSDVKNGGCTIEDCVNYGDINQTEGSQSAGGIIGQVNNIIKDDFVMTGCANLGDITGYDAGGLVGRVSHSASCYHYVVRSSYNRGTVAARREGGRPSEAIGYFDQAKAHPSVEVAGSMLQSDVVIGAMIVGATIKEEIIEDNVYAATSEGLVDGSDLDVLNAFGEGCDLWKQGSVGPILKIMPDEPAPDTITVRFKDAAEFESALLKTCIILRGGTPVAPAWPEHEGYTFLNWDPENFEGLQADTDIVAVYQHGTIEHKVRFFDWDGTQIGEDQSVEHGKAAIPPPDPVREGHKFLGWDADFSSVIEDLDVTATYVRLVQDVATGEELAEALKTSQYPEVTYCLKNDVELDAAWEGIEFVSTLDGEGHVIRYAGKKPLFAKLTGCVRNLVLDGETEEGEKTSITGINTRFGLIAASCSGGTIANVTIRNYDLEVANTASGLAIGIFCGAAGDGSLIERCTVDESCSFRTRSCTVAGFAATSLMSDTWKGDDPRLLTVLSCTNNIDIVTWSSGAGTVAGIVADCSSGDSLRRPDIVISNCVNYGSFYSVYNGGVEGRFAGIVANRYANISTGQLAGTLTIVDCANYGDIDTMGGGYSTSSKSTVNFYGGIVAYTYRLGAIWIQRCQNRGRIGSPTWNGSNVATNGFAGGIMASLSDVYGARPIAVSDCANYGDVYGGQYAGGIFGYESSNGDYGGVAVTATNSANYGAIEVGDKENGLVGEWIGYLGSNPKKPKENTFGVWNSFFTTTNIVGRSAGYETQIVNCQTAQDAGYTAGRARKALSAWAEANGYEPWTQGKVDGKVYPELGIFCEKPYVAGFMLFIR